MLIKTSRGWELPDSAATPESVFMNRRTLLKGLASGPLLAAGAAVPFVGAGRSALADEHEDPSAHLYPVEQNPAYTLDRPLSPEDIATTYNNYYEFGSYKEIWQEAQALKIRPWTVEFDGLVEEPMTIGIDDLLAKMPLEERLYRHRCVEAWSIAVPYSGFPLKALVDFARPLGDAKYLVMQTFEDDDVAEGQRQFWYPWPYIEGLTMAEATNELAFIATGYYGKPIPKQNGAPPAPRRAVEVRLQAHQGHRALQLHGRAAGFLLGGAGGQRVRLLGQRQSASAAPALEPGERAFLRARWAGAPPDPALQRLCRAGRLALRRHGERAALHVALAPPNGVLRAALAIGRGGLFVGGAASPQGA